MSKPERLEIIQLLMFMTGRPEVFYSKMTDKQLREEYERLSNGKR